MAIRGGIGDFMGVCFMGPDFIVRARRTASDIVVSSRRKSWWSLIYFNWPIIIMALTMLAISVILNHWTSTKHWPGGFRSLMVFGIFIVIGYTFCGRYHGAEHKVINTYQKTAAVPNLEAVRKASRFSQSCGTMLIPILLIFAIAGCNNWWLFAILAPMLMTLYIVYNPKFSFQWLTTREPIDQELEVAIAAFSALIKAEPSLQEEVATAALFPSSKPSNNNH